MPYNHKRSPEAKKRREELRAQKRESAHFIRNHQFVDLVTREKVNLKDKGEIEDNLQRQFGGIVLAAVPNVSRAEVLEIPNVYHLELFTDAF